MKGWNDDEPFTLIPDIDEDDEEELDHQDLGTGAKGKTKTDPRKHVSYEVIEIIDKSHNLLFFRELKPTLQTRDKSYNSFGVVCYNSLLTTCNTVYLCYCMEGQERGSASKPGVYATFFLCLATLTLTLTFKREHKQHTNSTVQNTTFVTTLWLTCFDG